MFRNLSTIYHIHALLIIIGFYPSLQPHTPGGDRRSEPPLRQPPPLASGSVRSPLNPVHRTGLPNLRFVAPHGSSWKTALPTTGTGPTMRPLGGIRSPTLWASSTGRGFTTTPAEIRSWAWIRNGCKQPPGCRFPVRSGSVSIS